ncbi:MAG: ABC transporter permease, partial [Planctomycetota bacterium]
MATFLLRRLLQMALVLVVLSFIIVGLLRAMPGNPLDQLKADPRVKAEDIRRLTEMYGYNDPIEVFYAKRIERILHGDIGYSVKTKQPVADVILPYVFNTLKLTVSALLLSLLIAIPLGVYSAEHQYSAFDYTVNLFAFIGVSFPSFFLANVLILIFATGLNWFPPGQMNSDINTDIIDELRHLVLPTIALATLTIGSWTRYMRNAILEVNQLDFVRTAVAKGVPHDDVLWRHTFRNSLIPLITLLALSM